MVKFTANGNTEIGKGIDKALPSEKESITLPTETLKQYPGKYELQPTFHIVIEVKDDKVFATATGQQQFEVFASAKDEFFLKVVPAEIVFNRTADGTVESLTLKQGGNNMLGKKVE
jgi:hypothetical protein